MNRPHRNRRSPRLAGFDYRHPGLYFVTICTAGRACVFGDVVEERMVRSPLGQIAHGEWERTLRLRPTLVPDVFVVMPNHVHLLFGIAAIPDQAAADPAGRAEADPAGRAEARLSPTRTLRTTRTPQWPATSDSPPTLGSPSGSVPAVVGAYKSAVTRKARQAGLWEGEPLWQARFHDRIVRDAREAGRIRRYILDNPLRWNQDRYRP